MTKPFHFHFDNDSENITDCEGDSKYRRFADPVLVPGSGVRVRLFPRHLHSRFGECLSPKCLSLK